jgi:DNA-binding MarR family transcriptional regulator
MAETTARGKSRGFPPNPHGKEERSTHNYGGIREWQAELSISRLFRTSIRLQTAFDRCFSQFGMTAQEAAVLVHCAEEGETSAGKLAKAMGRDKGKITRFVDRLEANGFLTRRPDSRDHRLQIIKATNKGRRAFPDLRLRFEEVRGQFFEGVLNVDLDKLEALLSQLHANAERLCEKKARKAKPG